MVFQVQKICAKLDGAEHDERESGKNYRRLGGRRPFFRTSQSTPMAHLETQLSLEPGDRSGGERRRKEKRRGSRTRKIANGK